MVKGSDLRSLVLKCGWGRTPQSTVNEELVTLKCAQSTIDEEYVMLCTLPLKCKVKDWETLVIGGWCMMVSLAISLQNNKVALSNLIIKLICPSG